MSDPSATTPSPQNDTQQKDTVKWNRRNHPDLRPGKQNRERQKSAKKGRPASLRKANEPKPEWKLARQAVCRMERKRRRNERKRERIMESNLKCRENTNKVKEQEKELNTLIKQFREIEEESWQSSSSEDDHVIASEEEDAKEDQTKEGTTKDKSRGTKRPSEQADNEPKQKKQKV